ncbi:MAG: hypothetical protein JNM14_09320 [Ferruginibacter sp.]|nr:hypothetical protein [Ferruginibacter sp.]
MQELITRLTEKAGLSADQATKAIHTVKGFIKEKFPMLGDAVDNMFPASADNAAPAASAASATAPKAEDSSMLDKISDVIPGQMGEKIEDFAKDAADKLGNLFGGDKK